MATFQKLTDVNVIEVLSDSAKVFVEDGGELKRVAKSQVGGVGAFSDMPDVLVIKVGNAGYVANKTFDEVVALVLSDGLNMVVISGATQGMFYMDLASQIELLDTSANVVISDVAYIHIAGAQIELYMTPDNQFSTRGPSGDPS